MTLQNLFFTLIGFDDRIQGFLSVIGPDSDGDFDISDSKAAPEELFLKKELETAVKLLIRFHGQIDMLRRPTHGEHTLVRFPDGRYGYLNPHGERREFTCGDPLEVRLPDPRYGCERWVRTHMEHNGMDYCLACRRDLSLCGLAVRERR